MTSFTVLTRGWTTPTVGRSERQDGIDRVHLVRSRETMRLDWDRWKQKTNRLKLWKSRREERGDEWLYQIGVPSVSLPNFDG